MCSSMRCLMSAWTWANTGSVALNQHRGVHAWQQPMKEHPHLEERSYAHSVIPMAFPLLPLYLVTYAMFAAMPTWDNPLHGVPQHLGALLLELGVLGAVS